MAQPLIQARQLNSFYGASHILRDIDFAVAAGETVGLMGRNGMGKSTLLKTIMGLVKPRSGSVEIMGRTMTGRAPYEIAALGVAYVPEGRGIFGNLSVVENLKMAARAGSTDAARARARAGQDWGCDRVLDTFPRLRERLGIPHSLAQIIDSDARAEHIGVMATRDTAAGGNPIPFTQQEYTGLFLRAYEGSL